MSVLHRSKPSLGPGGHKEKMAAAPGNRAHLFDSSGFTLIELIVVMALMGIVLFVAIPRIEGNPFLDDTRESARWLINKVRATRESAVRDQLEYILHIDLDTNRVWETKAGLDEEAAEKAALSAHGLPDAFRIADVQYPRREPQTNGRATIHFYRSGVTDKALIHVRDGESHLTFVIETFLSDVRILTSYAGFEDV